MSVKMIGQILAEIFQEKVETTDDPALRERWQSLLQICEKNAPKPTTQREEDQ